MNVGDVLTITFKKRSLNLSHFLSILPIIKLKLTSWFAGMSCRATNDIIVPRMGWTANRTNSDEGLKLWFTLWPKVALYLKKTKF